MFTTLPRNPQSQSHFYTPYFPSPLSSSPTAPRSSSPSPSPLSPRNANTAAAPLFPIITGLKTIMPKSPTPTPAHSYRHSNTSTHPQHHHQTPSTSTTTISNPLTPPQSRPQSHTTTAFSKRGGAKPNPLFGGQGNGNGNGNGNSREEGRETRRRLFLKKVREGAEEKRWRDRGGDEEIMRMLWVGEERRGEERRRRERERELVGAGLVGVLDGEIEVEVEGEENGVLSLDEAMVDEVAMREEMELEALLGDLQHEQQQTENNIQLPPLQQQLTSFNAQDSNLIAQPPTPTNTTYGSDDDEYDNIFMDVIEEEMRMSSQRVLTQENYAAVNMHSRGEEMAFSQPDQDMMDMS